MVEFIGVGGGVGGVILMWHKAPCRELVASQRTGYMTRTGLQTCKESEGLCVLGMAAGDCSSGMHC